MRTITNRLNRFENITCTVDVECVNFINSIVLYTSFLELSVVKSLFLMHVIFFMRTGQWWMEKGRDTEWRMWRLSVHTRLNIRSEWVQSYDAILFTWMPVRQLLQYLWPALMWYQKPTVTNSKISFERQLRNLKVKLRHL